MISKLYAKFCTGPADEAQRQELRAEIRRRIEPLREILGELTGNDEEELGIAGNGVHGALNDLLDMLFEEDEG